MEDYFNYTTPQVKKGLLNTIDKMKIYAHGEDPKIFDLIDFEDDICFGDPLLVSHFFAKHNKRETMPVRDLLIGYSKNSTTVSPNHFNIFYESYIPNVGYFNKNTVQSDISFQIEVKDFCFQKRDQFKLKGTNIEIYQTVPELLEFQFISNIKNNEISIDPKFIQLLTKEKISFIEKAFEVMKSLLPQYCEQILLIARGIMLFQSNSEYLVSFASRVSPGVSYINVQKKDELIFFIVELIHQFGHNIFYKILENGTQYFKVNPDIKLRDLNGNSNENRSLYSAFHGLFTTTKVAYGLEILLKNLDLFTLAEQHEIIGRFVDNKRRYRTGLEKIDFNSVFTQEGIILYTILDEECNQIYERNKEYWGGLDVKNQVFVYNHSLFLKDNPQLSL